MKKLKTMKDLSSREGSQGSRQAERDESCSAAQGKRGNAQSWKP
jgi:hypothetical protein